MRFFIAKLAIFLFFSFGVQASDGLQTKNRPVDTLTQYVQFLERGEKKNMPYLYSEHTRPMMSKRSSSTGIMKAEAKTIRSCGAAKTVQDGALAVIFFPQGERKKCNPYFFVLEKDGYWRLDFFTMSKVIRFDHANSWWWDKKVKSPYDFAYESK